MSVEGVFDYSALYEVMGESRLRPWLEVLPKQVEATVFAQRHGKLDEWGAAIEALPNGDALAVELKERVSIGTAEQLTADEHTGLVANLRRLHPWRKGPFWLYGHHIDTEWRSDWKWDRLVSAIEPLSGRRVLDVGCGNGYHCWRMMGEGARQVIGLDPFLVFVMQFHAVQKLLGGRSRLSDTAVLPLGIEALPEGLHAFDTVFSMGVLYHRRSPFDHLYQLRDALRSGGELVLETIVTEGEVGQVLVPEGRYAQMRNVWCLPSVPTLVSWLRKCKFRDVQVVDVTRTTTAEQRRTDWMTFHSLEDYLDPADSLKTIEGHPAPVRAVITAKAP